MAINSLKIDKENTNGNHNPKKKVTLLMGGGIIETSIIAMMNSFNIDLTLSWSDEDLFLNPLTDRVDVLIFINRSPHLEPQQRQNLQQFAEAGGGIIVLNQSTANYPDWTWWHEELVGGRYLDTAVAGLPSSQFHLQEQIIAFPTGTHPITERLGGRPFHMLDETFSGMDISNQNQIILRTRNSSSDGPLMWVSSYSQTRVVVALPGFGHGAHLNHAFRLLIEGAIEWACQSEELVTG